MKCALSIVLVLIPRHNMVAATRKKTNSIPEETRTHSLSDITTVRAVSEIMLLLRTLTQIWYFQLIIYLNNF